MSNRIIVSKEDERQKFFQMKKRFLILCLTILSIFSCFAQYPITHFYDNAYYEGYWGGWCINWAHELFITNNEIICVQERAHPASYIIKFSTTDHILNIDKKTRKNHWKKKEPFTIYGIIYIRKPKKMTITQWLSEFPHMGIGKDYETLMFSCTLTILPYKKVPLDYILAFDNYAISFKLDKDYF